MFSFKGIGIKIFALILAIVAIVIGIYLTFFHSSGFVKTQATVTAVEKIEGIGDEADANEYEVSVEHTVDGKRYAATLNMGSTAVKVGQSIKVLYDPKDPTVVHTSSFLSIYAIVVGAAILAVLGVSEFRKRKGLQKVKAVQEERNGIVYPPSAPGPRSQLYFLTDLGTTKAGHRIEDASRNVLYEAKMTKFTLTAPFEFDFIDYEHNVTTPHLVGHEEETDWGGGLLLDNHFTFSFDGEDIWKHLKRNGITVESSLTGKARTEYKIFRDGQQIATAVSSSQNVHEEDVAEKSKLASLIPVQGFYRISTTETDLSLLFVTLLAFARSGASDDRGGNMKTLWNTVKKASGNRSIKT